MAIIANSYTSSTIKRLQRQTRVLLKNQSLPFSKNQNGKIGIAAVFDIQHIKYYNESEIKYSAPEGYRVVLVCAEEIFGALDFYLKGKRLHFSSAFGGLQLDNLITALNLTARKYAHIKVEYKVSCIEFLHASQPYLAVFSNKKFEIWTLENYELKKLTRKQIQSRLSKIKTGFQ